MAKTHHHINLAKVRRARQRKRIGWKAAAAKRTLTYQTLKKKGITSDIGIEGMKVTTTVIQPMKVTTPLFKPITKGRQTGPKSLIKRQRLKHLIRAQTRIGRKTIEVRKVVSQRARTHPMEAAGIGQPQTPQQLLLESTAIKKFKYWIEQRRLRIWFVEGGVYDYYNVPESVVITLSQAQSKGRYFYYNIRQVYTRPNIDFRRIR